MQSWGVQKQDKKDIMSNNNFDEKKEYLLCKEKDKHNKRKKNMMAEKLELVMDIESMP